MQPPLWSPVPQSRPVPMRIIRVSIVDRDTRSAPTCTAVVRLRTFQPAIAAFPYAIGGQCPPATAPFLARLGYRRFRDGATPVTLCHLGVLVTPVVPGVSAGGEAPYPSGSGRGCVNRDAIYGADIASALPKVETKGKTRLDNNLRQPSAKPENKGLSSLQGSAIGLGRGFADDGRGANRVVKSDH